MRRQQTCPHPAGRRGQSLAEFALVAPVFFLILLGIIEGGRFMFYYEMLNHATREGARYAIVNGGNSPACPTGPPAAGTIPCDVAGDDVRQRVRESALGIDPTAIAVDPTWWDNSGAPGTNGRGQRVRVEATYTYSTLVPLVPLPAITITAESTLVVNN